MGMLFRMVTTTEHKDTYEVNVFYRMVMPNINIHCVTMSHFADINTHNSMTNAIMADAEGLEESIPDLDAKFSISVYKFTKDGPDENKVCLFSCMGVMFDQ
jgi:hypothetical protein